MSGADLEFQVWGVIFRPNLGPFSSKSQGIIIYAHYAICKLDKTKKKDQSYVFNQSQ